jgi:hypothetical protein
MNLQTKPVNADTRASPARPWNDELADAIVIPPQPWQDPGYSASHYAKVGLLLGGLGGCTSLVANVIGSVLWPAVSGQAQHPLRLIQVYLTFPLGESAMTLDSGILLALGSVMYLTIGMLYGMLIVLAMSYFVPNADVWARLLAGSILALFVWLINFYLLLSWLQPLLLGGRWIAELIPWWVGALTHLVFGWTVALLYPVGTPILAKPTINHDAAA